MSGVLVEPDWTRVEVVGEAEPGVDTLHATTLSQENSRQHSQLTPLRPLLELYPGGTPSGTIAIPTVVPFRYKGDAPRLFCGGPVFHSSLRFVPGALHVGLQPSH